MAFDRRGFDKEVGILLGAARKRANLTQGQLADKMGVERTTYSNVESGRQRIFVDVVWRAAVVLGVPVQSLLPVTA